jgi:hypothetical protein
MKNTTHITFLAVALAASCTHTLSSAQEAAPQASQTADKKVPAFQEMFIPSSIRQVETHSVDQSLIRIIRFNMEIRPLVVIERFAAPGVEIAERMLITSLQVNGETLDFEDCADVGLESLVVKASQVEMVFEFTPAKASEPRRVNCIMSLKGNKLGHLQCSYLPEKDE